nr:MAG TPA: Endonuclease [Caudoviricetes sp.]
MAINVNDLPPKYQRQALKKYMEQQARRGLMPSAAGPQGKAKANKYHNTPTERVTASGAVLHFDSQKEARRYDVLTARLQAGQIRDLRLQVEFTLQEAYTDTEGCRVRAIRYKADFTYYRPPENGSHAAYWADQTGTPWVLVVEDVKSRATKTQKYAIKKKLLKERFGLDITEV